ncbi:hypothetical protein FUA26_04575 [Seonamhaeicola algicola]|uniref:T9SS C-terminal target domain-containing protein n=1 Tax=Seonamhaeicola algicola TaxID=1719036 RepID=A0A5C7B3F9_9FLAO|nr:hypothetical protein [Seonamhaeicola algicola]TXE13075.1 hypothetical protein FUA26_04575 [Seonamhaeicola algicola]
MNTLLKHTRKGFIIVAMAASVISYASNDNTIVKDAAKTAITLNNVKEGNLLTIKDAYGVTLYKELIKQDGIYTKGFDLTALPEGNYFFELEKDVEIKTIPFSVNNNKVNFKSNSETIYHKPVVVVKEDLVYVTKLSPKGEAFTVNVYGIDNGNSEELLYTETITGTQSIEKIYRLESGNYKIVFNSNNKDFTKFINN